MRMEYVMRARHFSEQICIWTQEVCTLFSMQILNCQEVYMHLQASMILDALESVE
jgi:hypothetical protein